MAPASSGKTIIAGIMTVSLIPTRFQGERETWSPLGVSFIVTLYGLAVA
jgi:hypothetical protein